MKPCPFCKSNKVSVKEWIAGWSYYNDVSYFVYCEECKASGPMTKSIDQDAPSKEKGKLRDLAVKKWDTRHE